MKRILLLILCTCFLATCRKEKRIQTETLSTTTATTKGPLSGKVNQYDQFGTLYTTGLNTTTVSIYGKNFKSLNDTTGRYATSVTDSAGHYTLANIPTGTSYLLFYIKPGCGIMVREGVAYKVGDTTTYNAGVSDIPAFSINAAYARDTTWFAGTLSGIYYGAGTTPLNKNAMVVAIIGKSDSIDISRPASYLNYGVASFANTPDFNRFFSYPFLKQTYLFQADSVLFMKVYPVSTLASYYFDNYLNKPVYTSYGTAYQTITLTVH
jgi:hypothetical protein